MAAQDSALHLQVETRQAASSQNAGSRKHNWLFLGFGLAGLMLIAVSAQVLVPIPSDAESLAGSEKPSGHLQALAFNPAVPGIRTGELRPAKKGVLGQTRSSMPVRGPFHLSMKGTTTLDSTTLTRQEGPPQLSRRDLLVPAVVFGLYAMRGNMDLTKNDLTPLQKQDVADLTNVWMNAMGDTKDQIEDLTPFQRQKVEDLWSARLGAMSDTKELMKDLTLLQRQEVIARANAWMIEMSDTMDRMQENDLTPKLRQEVIDRVNAQMNPSMSDTKFTSALRSGSPRYSGDRMRDLTPKQSLQVIDRANALMHGMSDTMERMKDLTPKERQDVLDQATLVPLPAGQTLRDTFNGLGARGTMLPFLSF